jgi:ABC-type branched-subunit amino acid transport system substrate-binding protein
MPLKGISQDIQQSDKNSEDLAAYITIGLLLPDHSYSDVIKAAEFAIDQANDAGGYRGKDFKLIIRTAEGFWGAGSKESVSLVYEDQVRAIVGALDGRNGHLAEQVATKSHLSYIETYATEPTLSQAFVPWFMRVVPNDNQQSATILNQIQSEGGGSIGILSIQDYDTRYAVKSLTRAVASKAKSSPLVIELDPTEFHQGKVIEKILNAQINHLVIPFDASFLSNLIRTLKEVLPDLNIYGTLHFAMGSEKHDPAWKDYEGLYMIRPDFDTLRFPVLSDSRSVYMYDAINLVVHAIGQVGLDRVDITNYISGSKYSTALTGSISFDDLGNRQNASSLIQIRNGKPELIKQP